MFHELFVLSATAFLICVYAIVVGIMFALYLRESPAVEPIVNERDHESDDFG